MFIRFIECCIHNFVESSLARLICLRSHYHCQFWCLIKIEMTAFILLFQQLCWIICQQTDLSLKCNQMIISQPHSSFFIESLITLRKTALWHHTTPGPGLCSFIFLCLVLPQLFPFTAHGWHKIILFWHLSKSFISLHHCSWRPIPCAAYIARTDEPPSRQT